VQYIALQYRETFDQISLKYRLASILSAYLLAIEIIEEFAMLHKKHIAFPPFYRQFLFTLRRKCRHNAKRMSALSSGCNSWFFPPTSARSV
jgi:hypothetical protein